MELVEYPSTLSAEAIRTVVGWVRGSGPATAEAAHAAWNLQGFAMSQVLGRPPEVMAGTPPPSCEDVCLALERCADGLEDRAEGGGPAFGAAAGVPWQLILPVVLEWVGGLIKDWLANR